MLCHGSAHLLRLFMLIMLAFYVSTATRVGDSAHQVLAASPEQAFSMTITPHQRNTFKFGEVTQTQFVIKNTSDRALVILSIIPMNDLGDRPILLSKPEGGSLECNGDSYSFCGVQQDITYLPFHHGFLLPNQVATITTDYRPVNPTVSFVVMYVTSAGPFDGTPLSLLPLKVFLPGKQTPFTQAYIPATESTLKLYATGWPRKAEYGFKEIRPEVIIPDIPNPSGVIDKPSYRNRKFLPIENSVVQMPIAFEAPGFFLDEARQSATNITGAPAEKHGLTYSGALGGYVVFEHDCAWLLSDQKQKERGVTLPLFPPELIKELDNPRQQPYRVSIQIGQMRWHPDWRQDTPPKVLWDSFPIWMGSSLYMDGSLFVDISGANLRDFLISMRLHHSEIVANHYPWGFFDFTLKMPENERAEAGIPIGVRESSR